MNEDLALNDAERPSAFRADTPAGNESLVHVAGDSCPKCGDEEWDRYFCRVRQEMTAQCRCGAEWKLEG